MFISTHFCVISKLLKHECYQFLHCLHSDSLYLASPPTLCLYLPCCLYQWSRITSGRGWQSSAFHIFNCLCSLNHGFSVTSITSALHSSALDEQNAADIPGILETESPFALSECECSFCPMACCLWWAESLNTLNLIASWLLLYLSGLWISGQAVPCFWGML